ncbi:ABC transporter permease [Herpetosiphon giganteus]|uniref:ABC transporter permease n=1 Tax=Herpetosiphon giganteus TaxID=2029754 RepID=UPI00195D8A88|nr:ABC transporter permease [Herpetosiphon giganteus]MBM7843914.1 osmoprotectant transport system permease protein [Herpetosiphon giganteus]
MNDIVDGLSYLVAERADVWQLLGQHVTISLLGLVIASLIALPLGLLVVRVRWLAGIVMALLSILYTVPSLAMLIMLIAVFGLSKTTVVVTLVIYAQVILVRNIVVGMQSIDRAVLEAARGLGMNTWQIWWRVELPLALPIMLAGLRIAAIMCIAISSIAAMIGVGGLGQLLFQGITFDRADMIWAGTISIAVLALVCYGLLALLEQRLTPKI